VREHAAPSPRWLCATPSTRSSSQEAALSRDWFRRQAEASGPHKAQPHRVVHSHEWAVCFPPSAISGCYRLVGGRGALNVGCPARDTAARAWGPPGAPRLSVPRNAPGRLELLAGPPRRPGPLTQCRAHTHRKWSQIGATAHVRRRPMNGRHPHICGPFVSSGGGIRTRDLRVMSLSSGSSRARVITAVITNASPNTSESSRPLDKSPANPHIASGAQTSDTVEGLGGQPVLAGSPRRLSLGHAPNGSPKHDKSYGCAGKFLRKSYGSIPRTVRRSSASFGPKPRRRAEASAKFAPLRSPSQSAYKSGRLDLNQRPSGPQPSALLADTRCPEVS
jgi:hypothetical protein